jgi:hypothetical protein
MRPESDLRRFAGAFLLCHFEAGPRDRPIWFPGLLIFPALRTPEDRAIFSLDEPKDIHYWRPRFGIRRVNAARTASFADLHVMCFTKRLPQLC